ncbi:MAG: M28 family peptidase [Myxococcota bacterium]
MRAWKLRLWFYGCVLTAIAAAVAFSTSMPGSSYSGQRPKSTPALRELEARLRGHVATLATQIGARNVDRPEKLIAAREYIRSVLTPLETNTARLSLEDLDAAGRGAQNIIFEVSGRSQSAIVVVGAHYDSAHASPGANDNASGVAATLELASSLSRTPASKRVRFVFFANEEPPFFKTPGMGSRTNAESARRRNDSIEAMLAIETIGFYSELEGSQKYPWPIGLMYPSRGNFVGFVGDLGSRSLVRTAIAAFRTAIEFPSEGAALPATFPGVDWSDHWSFRQAGYPAIMITDTAIYRDPNYHRVSDGADQLDYDALARVTTGLEAVVRRLAAD